MLFATDAETRLCVLAVILVPPIVTALLCLLIIGGHKIVKKMLSHSEAGRYNRAEACRSCVPASPADYKGFPKRWSAKMASTPEQWRRHVNGLLLDDIIRRYT